MARPSTANTGSTVSRSHAGPLARMVSCRLGRSLAAGDRSVEEADPVRRVRDPHDRRRVNVELAYGPGLREIAPTFGPVVKAWRATAAEYSDDELRLLLEFQGKVEEIMRAQWPGCAAATVRYYGPRPGYGLGCRCLWGVVAVPVPNVLGGEPLDERGDLGADRRPSRPARVGPVAGDQAAVPPQDGAGPDQPVHPRHCRQKPDLGYRVGVTCPPR